MLDTLKLESPELEEATAAKIEKRLVLRSGVNLADDKVLYEITAGTLKGTWDSRISLRVHRHRMLWDNKEGRPTPRRCAPFLTVEGSVHKAMLGHNLYGGPEDLQASVLWLLGDLGARLGVTFPRPLEWLLRRVDWAECYELPYEACESYIWGLNNARFPRRKPLRYGEETAFYPGSTTAVKVYHKGPEFSTNDHKRLKEVLGSDELEALQLWANDTLRAEVGIKARKLDQEHGGRPTVGEVRVSWIKRLHRYEMARLVREGKNDMQTVRKQKDVRDRLGHYYFSNPRLAGLLFGTWLQLAALGEKSTKRHMEERTYYRHLAQLKAAGVSWHGADVLHVPSISRLPQDFNPLPEDPRRVVGEDPKVRQLLAPFRAA